MFASLRAPFSALLGAQMALAGAACGPRATASPGADGGSTEADSAPPAADARPGNDPTAVYAHSPEELFRVDPDTLEVALVGPFDLERENEGITDLAVDAHGSMLAISLQAIYSVNADTGAATHLTDLELNLTSLSFVPIDPDSPQGEERLIAANFDGTVYEIDPETGEATELGSYGTSQDGRAIGSSGDIVSVRGFGTVATVTVEDEPNDHLAWINPVTFEASLIGDTGVDRIFGIGFWKDEIYGFTDHREFVLIDRDSGTADEVETGMVQWWGAGVTTNAPVIE